MPADVAGVITPVGDPRFGSEAHVPCADSSRVEPPAPHGTTGIRPRSPAEGDVPHPTPRSNRYAYHDRRTRTGGLGDCTRAEIGCMARPGPRNQESMAEGTIAGHGSLRGT